jgi:hypothetical protein
MPPPAPQLAETSKQAVNVSLHRQLDASDRPSPLLLTLNCFGLWIPDGYKKSHGNVKYEEAGLAGIVSKCPIVVKV